MPHPPPSRGSFANDLAEDLRQVCLIGKAELRGDAGNWEVAFAEQLFRKLDSLRELPLQGCDAHCLLENACKPAFGQANDGSHIGDRHTIITKRVDMRDEFVYLCLCQPAASPFLPLGRNIQKPRDDAAYKALCIDCMLGGLFISSANNFANASIAATF